MSASSPRLYGRRKGRPLRARKSGLMEELLPRLRVELIEATQIDPKKLFDFKPQEIWLEIGFGGGEHLASQAKKYPKIGFIGCEPFVNGIASLLDHVDKERLANIRIFPGDARVLLDALPEASIGRCFILFPDPWPKARHAERRFVGQENIPKLARVLRKGGELRLATDDAQLTDWMRAHMKNANDFRLLQDSVHPAQDWISTRYEQKAIKAGCAPVYMAYVRR